MSIFSVQGIIEAFQSCYGFFASFLGYGLGLIAFSLFVSTLLLPLGKWAINQSKKEKEIEAILSPKIKQLKAECKGATLSNEIAKLYQKYSYNPIYSIRLSLPAFTQLPVLFLAFFALFDYAPLKGQSFLIIDDLSVPDTFLFGYALLPFVMTAINCITVYISPFSKKEQMVCYLLAFLFLLLLYIAPAALLIYWTSNNTYNLVKTIVRNRG